MGRRVGTRWRERQPIRARLVVGTLAATEEEKQLLRGAEILQQARCFRDVETQDRAAP